MFYSVTVLTLLIVCVLHLVNAANVRPHLVNNEEKLSATRNPDTVDELDVNAYLGLWYVCEKSLINYYFELILLLSFCFFVY